jgi:peroxin-3
MWDFWRRHKRKVYVTLGAFGSGYVLYKLYDTHRRRIDELERELASEKANDELVKAQMQVHFESIQRIADTTTLPHAMLYLSSRVSEELDLSHLTERLMKGKGQPNTLTSSEKLELWEKLKILSFTRMLLSVWSMTMLSLYIRVQVNIVGRHLYIDTARGFGASFLLDEAELNDRNDLQQFLATADFLSNYGMSSLISDMQAATTQVLKGKQLKDIFDTTILLETILQILNTFMNNANPNNWISYLMPQDSQMDASSRSDDTDVSDITKFRQLIEETHAVLSSTEFASVVDISLKIVVDALMEDLKPEDKNSSSGTPLAKLLPKVAQMGPLLLEEPSRNGFVQIIRNITEVEVFFTLLYSNIPIPS